MSADTTMAILKTRTLLGEEGCEDEYRVALVQAAENALPQSYPPERKPRMILFEGLPGDPFCGEVPEDLIFRCWYQLACFGNSRVYHDARTARKVARRKCYRARKRGRIVEYGVKTLDCWIDPFPTFSREMLEAAMRKHRVFPFTQG